MPAPLTDLQIEFAKQFAANGGNAREAAVAAGYTAENASTTGCRTAALPHVAELILKELMLLRARSGAIGLGAMIAVAQSTTAPAAARVSAARCLMEHAGLIGTAKEVADAREFAKSGNVVDYLAVLDALGKLPRASNDDAREWRVEDVA